MAEVLGMGQAGWDGLEFYVQEEGCRPGEDPAVEAYGLTASEGRPRDTANCGFERLFEATKGVPAWSGLDVKDG